MSFTSSPDQDTAKRVAQDAEDAKEILDIASAKALEIISVAQKAAKALIVDIPPQGQSGDILKELSDIKSSLAVNRNETANIKARIAEIQSDIREIKSDFITRRELNDALTSIRDEISPLRKFVYALIAIFGVAMIGAILKLVIK